MKRISVWSRINQTSIVLCNASSLHQLRKTSEIVTGWESTKIMGKSIFWPTNLKFCLYNLQILTLFWLNYFLPLQLQNDSAFSVEVIQKHIHAVYFKFLKNLVI